jgi:glutamate synthase domain-containing protein 2
MTAFGSTRNLTSVGTPIFVNDPFPTLDEEALNPPCVTIGQHCRTPYDADSIINISGMSYGALSKPAIRALSHGAKQAGCWLNTGEGGLAPYHLEGGCDVVFQIGTAKYGVRDEQGNLSDEKLREAAAHDQVKMFELKLSQGAKPGKGGILPADKVNAEIAAIRGIKEGEDSISPNRHVELKNIGDILDMIAHIREVTGKPCGFKTVVGSADWLDRMFDMVKERGIESAPDFIAIDGGDGGTGAAPMPLMDNVGLPLREALLMAADSRDMHGLSKRIRLIASGKLLTPAEAAWAFCAGADFVVTARGFMFALGCIQSLKCNKNTCPTGITTHDRRLQKGLDVEEKSVRVANFVEKLRYGVGLIAHSCGVPEPRLLRRHHVRVVQDTGRSILLSEMYEPVGEDTRAA